jgi:hypothetical protein
MVTTLGVIGAWTVLRIIYKISIRIYESRPRERVPYDLLGQ